MEVLKHLQDKQDKTGYLLNVIAVIDPDFGWKERSDLHLERSEWEEICSHDFIRKTKQIASVAQNTSSQ